MSPVGLNLNRQRFLIVRPTALGDVSRTVPVLVSLRHANPDAHIDWLVNETFADAVRHHPALDGLVGFPRRHFGTMYRNPRALAEAIAWAHNLRRRRYDLVVDVQGLFRSGLFTRLTGAPTRIGFANAREFGWLGYNQRHHINHKRHTVDRMLDLIEAAGFEPQHDMHLYVGDDDQKWLDEYLAAHNIAGEAYACLAPTARWRSKCWPVQRYADIAHRLLDTHLAGSRIVLLASPNERGQLQPLLNDIRRRNSNHLERVLVPQTTVGQLMAVLSRTRLLVCNDSAPLHIAVGFDRPIVTIFGPTDPSLVGPYQRRDTVLRPPGVGDQPYNYRRFRHDQSLIASISVDDVWQKIEQQTQTG
ncbi:MAG: glycosyltransferase family 9 protein [Phycisphaeraceae bacterium]